MNQPFVMLVLVLAVVVVAILGVMWVLGSLPVDQAIDIGLKAGGVLAILLVAGLVIGILGKQKK